MLNRRSFLGLFTGAVAGLFFRKAATTEPTEFFPGEIKNVQTYDRALSDAEVTEKYIQRELPHICYFCQFWTSGPAPDWERCCPVMVEAKRRGHTRYDESCDAWKPHYHSGLLRSHHDGRVLPLPHSLTEVIWRSSGGPAYWGPPPKRKRLLREWCHICGRDGCKPGALKCFSDEQNAAFPTWGK